MRVPIPANVLDHVDAVPSWLADNRVDLVRAALDERTHGHPSCSIICTQEGALEFQLVAQPSFFDGHPRVQNLTTQPIFCQPLTGSLDSILDAHRLELRFID